MSEQPKPRLEIKFANRPTIIATVIDVDAPPKMRDECALHFDNDGNMTTYVNGELSAEMRFDVSPEAFAALNEMALKQEEDVKRQAGAN